MKTNRWQRNRKAINLLFEKISSDSDDDVIPIKRKPTRQAKKPTKKLLEDEDEDNDDHQTATRTKKSSKAESKAHPATIPAGCKAFSLKIDKLPSDLKPIMEQHKLSTVLDKRNREVENFESNSNYYGELRRRRHTNGTEASKSKAKDSKKSKSQVVLLSETDSDEPIAKIASKSDNIPKNKNMSKRSTRSKRHISESDDDDNSDEDFEESKKSRTSGRTQRAAARAKSRKDSSDEDEDSNKDSDKDSNSDSDFVQEEPQPKKKTVPHQEEFVDFFGRRRQRGR